MAPATEGAHAFMPTSNDSLDAPAPTSNVDNNSSLGNSYSSSPFQLGSEIAVLSPPSYTEASNGLVSPTDMSLPTRQQVPSASQLPVPETHHPTDQVFWHSQYRRAIGIHESERKLWYEERQYLERQVASLMNELNKKRNDSGVSYSSGKENDKVFGDPEVIKQSQEKLRQLSNAGSQDRLRQFSTASPLSEQMSVGGLSASRTASDARMSDEPLEWRQPSFSGPGPKLPTSAAGKRLSSITEDDAGAQAPRRVSINATNTVILDGPDVQQQIEEDPVSPPTTTKLETPPHAKTYAGRTPPVPRLPTHMTVGDDSPSPTTSGGQIPMFQGLQDDPALCSPKILPTAPKSGHSDELEAFSQRLKEVAANPEEHVPEAVRRSNPSWSPSLPPPALADGQGEEEVGDIPLRTKRSMNFGAPLGNLRNS